MKFRATLCGVEGLERPKVCYSESSLVLDGWATQTLDALTDEQRKTAYVRICEQRWEPVRHVDGIPAAHTLTA